MNNYQKMRQKEDIFSNDDGENIIFKGWILTSEASTINNSSTTGEQSNNPIKWAPKYMIVNKFDKNVMLFDNEPSKLNQNVDEIINYRIDSFTNRDAFLNYWNNNKCLLNINLNNNQQNDENHGYSRDLSPLRENINHHLSNKEIESSTSNYDNDLIIKNDKNENIKTNSTSSAASAFQRLLFFKKPTKQHSSLKRAKSGIQLDRKKYSSTIGSPSQHQHPPPTPTLSSSSATSTAAIINSKSSLPASIRHSRSHECLSPTIQQQQHLQSMLTSDQILFIDNSFESQQNDENLIKFILTNEDLKQINSLHASLLNQENCFEIKYDSKNNQYTKKRFFLCRSTDERDKWLYILKYLLNSNYNYERRFENTMQLWILEAKGGCISSSSNKIKKFFCEILLNNALYGRTCVKEKKDLLFWGENFNFNTLKSEHMRIELFQDSVENSSKKKKKDSLPNKDKLPNLLGFIHLPLNSIESNQPIEKWYRLENSSDLLTTSVSLSSSTNGGSTMNGGEQQINSSSKTTTHDLNKDGKDSILIRVKAKYNCVDILPLTCYNRLIKYIQENYLKLMQVLEPHLNVRTKDDLSNTLVRLAYKLQIINNYLNDLIVSEILGLEDSSLIFRGNSLATKSMESFLKLVGESYLKYTLSDIVKSIIETNHDLEIDPSKVTNQNSLQSNREELIQILHLVCGRVFNSCSHFPKELKQIFCLLRETCLKHGKSDEMCDMLISASIFLRFICPAILSPNLFNLTQEYPQEKAARKLTLAAKTLQTIANFSKFGGKEFYMSFDKMNKFVDEHTVLMREFLRNISTSTETSDLSSNNSSTDSLSSATTTSSVYDKLTNRTDNYDDNNNDLIFNCDLIDSGKQLSILHSLLVNIISSLDKSVIDKLNPLAEILNEISSFKETIKFNEIIIPKSPLLISNKQQEPQEKSIPIIINTHNSEINNSKTVPQISSRSTSSLTASLLPTTKLIVYESPTNKKSNSDHVSLPIKIASAALDGVNSATKLLNGNSMENSSNFTVSNESSPSLSLTYSSEATINLVNSKPKENYSLHDQQLNNIMRRLSETEQELKREQEEKYLIEMKFKQNEQEHEQQMRNLINRLIKVEEELKREKHEMNKLLKAKQEIIDVQKKRIEGMASRLAHTQYTQNQQTRYNTTSNVKNKSNNISDLYNGTYKQQQQQPLKLNHNHSNGNSNNNIKPYSTSTVVTTPSTLNNNPLLNLNANHFLRTSEL